MRYIKKLISTLASMNYYSGGNDLLDDHSTSTYLQFVSEESLTSPRQNNVPCECQVPACLSGEMQKVEVANAKMNNSYPSS
ncbi:hypothetical protein [Vibrio campbellii]|uniref:hypothetical protein n=1 Tax=Vibrio campbellii TaxID=680 RepID=UPI00142E33E3|nr:hypothetical protein [Vibrio campbellii]NIY86667.1 hypothetical protein [Vibrio campbellii]NVK71159.1 hypothetical protein [Vibrio campbellii]